MPANWSLVLNVLLLIGVVIAISRMMKARRDNLNEVNFEPPIGKNEVPLNDDIIAVRKINGEEPSELPVLQPKLNPVLRPSMHTSKHAVIRPINSVPSVKSVNIFKDKNTMDSNSSTTESVMMFLLAKDNRQLAGYELLQTVLAAGLRFGDGHLFHRHQSPNGQGPVLFSLAAATASGVFDMQNIGAFSVHGLCLFMHISGSETIDRDRFAIMLDTAKQLSDGLDTHLLDDQRQPINDLSLKRYYRMLNIDDTCEEPASA